MATLRCQGDQHVLDGHSIIKIVLTTQAVCEHRAVWSEVHDKRTKDPYADVPHGSRTLFSFVRYRVAAAELNVEAVLLGLFRYGVVVRVL